MAALLARRERDGLSLRKLAEATGIPFGTLAWWSWRLRQDSSGESGGSSFIEVLASGGSTREAVIVRFGNADEIEVPPGTDVTWLGSLATALRPC